MRSFESKPRHVVIEPMRDEGDLHVRKDFSPGGTVRAIIIASVIGWAALGLVAVGVLRLFHHS